MLKNVVKLGLKCGTWDANAGKLLRLVQWVLRIGIPAPPQARPVLRCKHCQQPMRITRVYVPRLASG